MGAAIYNILVGSALLLLLTLILCQLAIGCSRVLKRQFSSVGLFLFLISAGVAVVEAQKRSPARMQGEISGRTDQGECLSSGGTNEMAVLAPVRFTAIEMTTNVAFGTFAWVGADGIPDATTFDILAAWPTLTNRFEWIDSVCVTGLVECQEWSVTAGQLGLDVLPSSLFLKMQERVSTMSTMADADGDLLPNVYEVANGTNPYRPDYDDVPKLTVGEGGDFGTIAAALSASSPYSVIELNGDLSVGSSIVMPPHPVLLTGPTNGYAFVRSGAFPGVFRLEDGQDCHTMFRNLYVDLLISGNLQAAFWCGGSLPIGIAGGTPAASASFENIYVHARDSGKPGKYFGWFARRADGGRISLDRCVVNAAGVAEFTGICAIDANDVDISNCTFVNFAANGIGIEIDNVSNAESRVNLERCVFDDSFTNAAPILRDGLNCVVTVVDSAVPRPFDVENVPEICEGLIVSSNCVAWSGHAVPGSIAEMREIGALAALGEGSAIDSDGDGLTDWDEAYVWRTDMFAVDSDGDCLDDGIEIAHLTDPMDAENYCFEPTFVISNRNDRASYMKVSFGESVYVLTNEETIVEGAHVVVTGGSNPPLTVFVDVNSNDVCDAEESLERFSYRVTGHSLTNCFIVSQALSDRDRDGLPDVWELQHGLCPTNAEDGLLDGDGDGLVNLHEYWAKCDPCFYDGTNTAIYAAVHGVDDRINNTTAASAAPYYAAYSAFINSWANNHECDVLPANTNCWMREFDLSCLSVACDQNESFNGFPVTVISSIHVIGAAHVTPTVGTTIAFRSYDGLFFVRHIVDTQVLAGVADEDIFVGILEAALPSSIRPVEFLPSNYRDYLGKGTGVPWVRIGKDKTCSVSEISEFSFAGTQMTKMMVAHASKRREYYRAGWAYDSGHPIFLIFGNQLAFLCPAKGFASDGIATGYLCASFLPMIQMAMDDLSDKNNHPRYELQQFSFTPYEMLENAPR